MRWHARSSHRVEAVSLLSMTHSEHARKAVDGALAGVVCSEQWLLLDQLMRPPLVLWVGKVQPCSKLPVQLSK